jgi:hypothetical protein
VTLTNVVSGVTNAGTLSLSQIAEGGAGGGSAGGAAGKGGATTSNLTFDDTLSATHSNILGASSTASGGKGGAGPAGPRRVRLAGPRPQT